MGTNTTSSSVGEEQDASETDDVEMLPTLPAETLTSSEESSSVSADDTPVVTGRRYPQCEHRLPLQFRPENFI